MSVGKVVYLKRTFSPLFREVHLKAVYLRETSSRLFEAVHLNQVYLKKDFPQVYLKRSSSKKSEIRELYAA
jgi:hypothetical protein